jgi:hypothetical protein
MWPLPLQGLVPPLHLSRGNHPFPAQNTRNTHENSHLHRGRGRALHLSRFLANSLILLEYQTIQRPRTVTTLPQKRVKSAAKPSHLSRGGVASLRANGISTSTFNHFPDPPVSSPVVTCKSFFKGYPKERSSQETGLLR